MKKWVTIALFSFCLFNYTWANAAGYWAANAKFLVNGFNSPLLRSAVVSPIASAAGHIAGGTTANLFGGQSLNEAFLNSFKGIGQSMLINGAIGVGTTIAVSYASGINPFNNRQLNASKHAQQRTAERNISQTDINDALKDPLKVTEVKYDAQGRPSIEYIGKNVTVVVNPETGKIITVHGTHTKLFLKLTK